MHLIWCSEREIIPEPVSHWVQSIRQESKTFSAAFPQIHSRNGWWTVLESTYIKQQKEISSSSQHISRGSCAHGTGRKDNVKRSMKDWIFVSTSRESKQMSIIIWTCTLFTRLSTGEGFGTLAGGMSTFDAKSIYLPQRCSVTHKLKDTGVICIEVWNQSTVAKSLMCLSGLQVFGGLSASWTSR